MSANISQLNKDKPKKIAVIGIGNVGGALAGRWKSTGHEILVGSRNPENNTSGYTALTVQDAARQADIILVATPGKAMPEVATSIGSIPGKI
ncbi:MAG: NAD(P)-binding domain-containing protein, partial [Leptospiraceae bacterium]|nr:NAD(P)-binding domain-containing protein [Leptospiraceae bacterium]